MQICWKERGKKKSVPAPSFSQTIFNRTIYSFHLLRHCTYSSKLSLKFNTQRVPWNLNKSTGKQLTSFWLERWWEEAEGWREAWKLWLQAKEVGRGQPYSQHLVGECDYNPLGSWKLYCPPACLLLLPVLALGSPKQFQKVALLLWQAGAGEAGRQLSPPRPAGSGAFPASSGTTSPFLNQQKCGLPNYVVTVAEVLMLGGSEGRRKQKMWHHAKIVPWDRSRPRRQKLLEAHLTSGVLAWRGTWPKKTHNFAQP